MLSAIRARMRATAARLRLPLRGRVWRGESGNWMGAGIGSSIDFQDHRPYQPGDDPRYIDWRTYARTDQYTMKLFREEVSPRVDVALDISASMFFDDAKRERALELFYFCAESALQAGASLRCCVVSETGSAPWPVDASPRELDLARLAATPPEPRPPALARVPWRQGSLRAVISDLLFPGSPEPLLALLAANKGRGVVFAPYCAAEDAPDLGGNVELVDCETRARRVQHFDAGLAQRYARGYERHFAIWREHCRRHAVLHARVAAGIDFQEALRQEALRSGAVELSH
jgi:uncharacterized protein (DUF58 family)